MYEELVRQLRAYTERHCPLDRASGICGCIIASETADAIEELSREIDIDNAAMAAMDAAISRWIPAAERLPEDTHPVLVTYLGYNDKLPKSDMVAMCDGGDWYWYDDESKCKVAITHWMPLPQPPKEES